MSTQPGSKGKILVSGILFFYPLAGVTFQFLHYLLGLRRLGYDPIYVEDSGRYVYDPVLNSTTPLAERNVATVTLHRKVAFPLANVLFVLLAFPMITWFSRLKSYLASATLVAVYFTLASPLPRNVFAIPPARSLRRDRAQRRLPGDVRPRVDAELQRPARLAEGH